MKTKALIEYLDAYLEADKFQDYAPNGLQVEGSAEIKKIALGVSASLELIEKAKAMGADTVLVHHGWFWKNEPRTVVGMRRRRLGAVIEAGLNLIAYHLPLDAHREVGNNAELARLLGLTIEKRTGFLDLLHVGSIVDGAMTAQEFAHRVESVLGRRPQLFGDPEKLVQRVGWCSGAAQSDLLDAADLGCDLFLSGEVREATPYEARETGCVYLAGGHSATEQFGVQALGRHIEAAFPDVQCIFIPVENPV